MNQSDGTFPFFFGVFVGGFLMACILGAVDQEDAYRQHMIETGVARWNAVDGDAEFVLVKPPTPAKP